MTNYVLGVIIGFVLGISATAMVAMSAFDSWKAQQEPIIEFDSQEETCGPLISLKGPVFETFVDVVEHGKAKTLDK